MAKVELTPIKSSGISHIGYDQESRQLHVKFKNGDVYSHDDVPLEKYAAFTGSDSAGKFYNKKIKDAHPGKKLPTSK